MPQAPGALAVLMGRALRGTPSIVARQVVTAGLTVLAGIVLARVLSPSEFGVYALILIVIGVVRVVTDGGLGASLVRMSTEPTRNDYAQVFSLQSGLGAAVAISIVGLVALVPTDTYDVQAWGPALALTGAGALFAPFTGNATAFLERSLDYSRLGLVSATQPIVFALMSIATTLAGGGVVGIGAAALASFASSAGVARISRSPLGITSDFKGLRDKARFGVPFAGTQLVSLTKDGVVPLLLGIVFSAAAAGGVAWAQQVAVLPALFVTSFARYLFPMFSRLTADRRRLSRAVNTALIMFNCSVAAPALALLLWHGTLTSLVYGDQWASSADVLVLLVVANFFAPTTGILLAVFNALDRPRVALLLSFVWFAGTWALVPVFSIALGLGPIGFAWANLLLQAPGVVLLIVALRHVDISVVRSILVPWLVAAVCLGSGYGLMSVNDVLGEASWTVIVAVSTTLVCLAVCTRIFRGDLAALRSLTRR